MGLLKQSQNQYYSGVKSFTGGIGGASLGTTARAASGVLDAVSVRRLDIVRNIAENLINPLMRKWMSYNSQFLSPEEIQRITNTEFVQPPEDDHSQNIDLQIEVSTAEDNSAKAQELAFLLQTLGQNMDPAMQNLIMSQISKLNKMPDLAKMIEEFKPQPDPYIEQMKQLELKMKEVEIMERESRAMENQVDMRLKAANAALAEAKVGMMNSDTDLKDLDFTRRADGTEFNERMQEKGFDRDTSDRQKAYDRDTQAGLKRMDQLTAK